MEEQIHEIIRKATTLFHRYGIKSVSMDDIARELSISKKTLYKLFKDKTDLVSKVLDTPTHKTPTEVFSSRKLNAVEKHIMVYENIVEFLSGLNPTFEYDLKKYYPKLYSELKNKRQETISNNMKQDLSQGITEGFFREDLNIDIITTMNIIRIEGFQTMDVKEVYKYDLLDVIKEFFSYHFHAIATEKGLKEFERIIKERENE